MKEIAVKTNNEFHMYGLKLFWNSLKKYLIQNNLNLISTIDSFKNLWVKIYFCCISLGN